jgi:GTP-binding protein
MAFIDEMTLTAHAGRGGNGVVAFMHEKSKEFGGPGGGDGGKGGDVYIQGVRDIGRLAKYTHDRVFKAGRGKPGENFHRHGANGEDITIELPIGSLVTIEKSGKTYDLLDEEKILILKGGHGGFGNDHFKSGGNRTPEESTPGKDGESSEIDVKLRIIADAGFVGLPNAGKSSLLNALTNAKAKIGDYAFTTLDPNLGVLYGYVLADIPGIIEGAHEGKGLGVKFLKHVARTKMLLHCISLENEDLTATRNLVLKELESFDQSLMEKKEVVILTKSDTVTAEELSQKVAEVKKWGKEYIIVSVIDDESVKRCSDTLVKMLRAEK